MAFTRSVNVTEWTDQFLRVESSDARFAATVECRKEREWLITLFDNPVGAIDIVIEESKATGIVAGVEFILRSNTQEKEETDAAESD